MSEADAIRILAQAAGISEETVRFIWAQALEFHLDAKLEALEGDGR